MLKSFFDYGGRFEEMFMVIIYVKFYSVINIVGIVFCVVGKSNMFCKFYLECLIDFVWNFFIFFVDVVCGWGVDYFLFYICEDYLIGDLIFKLKILGFKNYGFVYGEVVI